MSTFRTPRRRARPALVAAITVTAALTGPVSQAASSPSSHAAAGAPSPGAAGLGDPIFPLDGNGGYKVDRYLLDFDWQAPNTPFEAATTISATATQALSRFDLDFAGNTPHTVTVNGKPAAAERDGDELVITPAKPLAQGKAFTVKVTYTADPTRIRHRDDAIEDYGWIATPDGTVLYPQPNGAKMIFPSNDHPSQRAPITFRITTPPGLKAVANGELTDRTEQADGRVKWTYDSEQPLATQLAQLAIGKFTFVDGAGPHGLPIRDVVPDDLVASTEQYRKLTADHIAWLEERLGPYPFNRYGLLVGDTDLGVALETQTLSLIPKADLLGDQVSAERNLVHELTHQWTGDSVGIKTWSDLWLSEGHARFYERLYSQAHGGVSFEDTMKTAYASHDQWRHDYGAPAEPTEPNLFKRMRYDGSALVLYALREKVGQETFGKIERSWVTKYRGKTAGTQDYIDLASKVSGQDLDSFLHPWLYGAKTPPMPNHPDWVVDPVQS
ncbi:M1 family metallopeptidase [Streptomyces sp. NBC_00996]|uniref:M1 family metallopeptidase n=1 Tax=Streptomyces sp. NBC_00996 TaxID=2903710 RepID=UPI003865DF7E|nr:M1 family metallopeptidase [Streptomyces sp. NBC_00996]